MQRIVLPTQDLLHEFKAFDPSFYFLEGGVRDVVREAVIDASYYQPNNRYYSPTPHRRFRSACVEYVIAEYERHIDQQQEYYTEFKNNIDPDYLPEMMSVPPPPLDINEYMENVGKLELLVLAIEQSVRELLQRYFSTGNLDIDHNSIQWHSGDLSLKAEIVNTWKNNHAR